MDRGKEKTKYSSMQEKKIGRIIKIKIEIVRRDVMIGASPDVIDKEEAFQDTYRKWRALIFKADIISVIAVFIS